MNDPHHRAAGAMLALLLALSTAPARADEADAGHAPPERWTHPRGPASCSGRSLARVPQSLGAVRWRLKAAGLFLAPPVTWDGVAFLLDGTRSRKTLLAVDTESGDVIARAAIKDSVEPSPAVHERSVFLVQDGKELVQYSLRGRNLTRRWSYAAGAGTYPPRIFRGEIYLAGPEGLRRLRAGSRRPVWTAEQACVGEPAVFGDHVYVLIRSGEKKLELAVHRRLDGERVHACVVAEKAPGKGGGRVVVTQGLVTAELPPAEERTWAILARKLDGEAPELELARTEKLYAPPLQGPVMLIAVTDPPAWSIVRVAKQPVFPLATEKDRPDLVLGAPSAISMQGQFCFGTWAADLNSNLILWHVDEADVGRLFDKGLCYNAVPAGHERLLLVPRDGKSVCAVGAEEIDA